MIEDGCAPHHFESIPAPFSGNGYGPETSAGRDWTNVAAQGFRTGVIGGTMMSNNTLLVAVGLMLAVSPALSQTPAPARVPQANWWSGPGREDGPSRIVWAAQKTHETPYTGPNKPL